MPLQPPDHQYKQATLHPHLRGPLCFATSIAGNCSTHLTTKKTLRMLESKAIIGDTDMLQAMQKDALSLAGKALDEFDITDSTEIARFIKKEFVKLYGQGWQCIIGTDFGSFVTHNMGCFIYFSIGSLAILLFRGAAMPEADTDRLITIESVKA